MNFSNSSLLILLSFLSACDNQIQKELPFDWQGHRGARGEWPENTWAAMRAALDCPYIRTLEMDLAVTADSVVVLSHEPWLSHEICQDTAGNRIAEAAEQMYNIYKMTYAQLQQYDCGLQAHPRFDRQQHLPATKPRLIDILRQADAYATEKRRPLPYYNIEIKSQPDYDGRFTPPINDFVSLVRQIVEQPQWSNRICIQSFDTRALEVYHRQTQSLPSGPKFALLVEHSGTLNTHLATINFKPDIYSPDYKLLTAEAVRQAHNRGIKVIPWTVNEPAEMQRLIQWGVDGIITDYPGRIAQVYADFKNR